MSGQNPREIAARILNRHNNAEDDFIEDSFDKALASERLSPEDRRLAQELVYGVLRWQSTLDWLINQKTHGRSQKPALATLLRLGLYQIFFLDRIPDHAAVHETVNLAKSSGFGPQAGFINAVLRGYLRESDATRLALESLKSSQPHIGYSHPLWLVDRARIRWGESLTLQWLRWNNSPPKTFARVNALKSDPGTLLALWRDENVRYEFTRYDWVPENLAFELASHPPLKSLASFESGRFYIQDPSTLLPVFQLDPQPGESILDLCAAPGGKATFIAQLINNTGHIVAHDPSPGRLQLVTENCTRLGITCVTPAVSLTGLNHGMTFDRILVDAPCSNTGVLRRRVDLRWRLRPEELNRLASAQIELLEHAAPLLKPAGTLVYSTCSLEPEENQDVIASFLQRHPEFQKTAERELLPFRDNSDGAYAARLKKSVP